MEAASRNSALMIAIQSLVYPVTTVLVLLVCLQWWHQPLLGPYFLIAVIGFTAVAELVDFSKFAFDGLGAFTLKSFNYVFSRWCVICIGICLLMYLSGTGHYVAEAPFIAWVLLTPFVLFAVRAGICMPLFGVSMRRMAARSAVIVGATEQGALLSQMLEAQPSLMINCVGYFDGHFGRSGDASGNQIDEDSSTPAAPGSFHSLARLGSTTDIAAYVRKHNIQLVYITFPLSRNPALMHLLEELQDSVASVYFVPDLGAFDLIGARVEMLCGIPLIAICESPFYGVGGLVKRCSDIVLSLTALTITMPLFLMVALGVKLSSPGPVIFKQRRYGLDGREIMVRKFRSMSVTEDGDNQYKQVTRNDSRVTPFGAFIRRTSLDELPQLLNVLGGSMSMVGPRPHAVAVNERYREQIPSYMIRHKVKPGITGWAQVNGYRGGDDLVTMTKRIEFDLKYLCNWSLWFDIKILFQTVAVVFKDTHAY
jgi:putative colanic acid biosynthesis UDP-glucose lipid carrier transferase